MIKDGGQNHTKGATINRFHVQVHVIAAPTEIKLFEGFKIVLLMHCFHLIVCISKQEEKWSIWLSIEKFLTNFYKSTLLVASDLNLCAIKSAFTWLLMNHFNFLLLLLLGERGGRGNPPRPQPGENTAPFILFWNHSARHTMDHMYKTRKSTMTI